ncbi:3-hydroxybutyryl-CoA dehydrogenase [Paenibacillus sp. LHD-117]|uniref:3-hydroxybutyryl-CoA dehydrogenase n=1 Tax=Paenibacillus sp. LHD-117 TaxID=3071412 RepID=UPI0027E095C9|nr:3-hydroxybutyryl-CoA dehydrogenase [Paenibacillus sp. LHD-117]MDQ6421563.1 3-hydroxybutyryl-CoA dehydrogenase [Paenibacillus sp. LHD-117]
MTTIRQLMVVGAGQMGSGIAQTAAAAGVRVLLHDLSPERAKLGLDALMSQAERDVEKGRKSAEEAAAMLNRIAISSDIADAAGADLVIEAIVENRSAKQDVFRRLDAVCAESAILASNTSSLSITEIAAATGRPDRVVGIHFMNPVPVMPLVELIRGLATSEGTFRAAESFARSLGKTPVEAGDSPGFVSNRVLMPMINEAIYCVYEGVAVPEAVDAIMKLGMRHPMGPLALADLIGLDTCLAIMEVLHQGFGDPKYRPCPLLRSYVHAGWLGKKAGRGFYVY